MEQTQVSTYARGSYSEHLIIICIEMEEEAVPEAIVQRRRVCHEGPRTEPCGTASQASRSSSTRHGGFGRSLGSVWVPR